VPALPHRGEGAGLKKLLFLGVLAGLAAVLAGRRRLPPERVDVYREDGTLQTFEPGAPLAEHVLSAAGEILSL
jgi:hypothetical protein